MIKSRRHSFNLKKNQTFVKSENIKGEKPHQVYLDWYKWWEEEQTQSIPRLDSFPALRTAPVLKLADVPPIDDENDDNDDDDNDEDEDESGITLLAINVATLQDTVDLVDELQEARARKAHREDDMIIIGGECSAKGPAT